MNEKLESKAGTQQVLVNDIHDDVTEVAAGKGSQMCFCGGGGGASSSRLVTDSPSLGFIPEA